jgi:hypothetical protein
MGDGTHGTGKYTAGATYPPLAVHSRCCLPATGSTQQTSKYANEQSNNHADQPKKADNTNQRVHVHPTHPGQYMNDVSSADLKAFIVAHGDLMARFRYSGMMAEALAKLEEEERQEQEQQQRQEH